MSDFSDDRRKSGHDHDLLVEVHSMLKGLNENFKEHKIDDEKHFSRLYSMNGNLKWYVGIGLGICMAAEVFLTKIIH